MMHNTKDTYKTLAQNSPVVLFKDRKSKFYGTAYPITTVAQVKPIIEALKKEYPMANHHCYAWQLGVDNYSYRANDDGEPKNSAGMPIYGQIQSLELTNVLVVVTRIFGGAKLGVSGLINAYKTAAQMALAAAEIEERLIESYFKLTFSYQIMNVVMRTIKRMEARVVNQQMTDQCQLTIALPQSQKEMAAQTLAAIHQLKVE